MSFGFLVHGISSFCGNAVIKITLGKSFWILSDGLMHLINPAGLMATINAQWDSVKYTKYSSSLVGSKYPTDIKFF